MKAIETRYKGYRFRSRLEARWAVFFDALEVEWQYEPEGFELPSGRYLPDFWLPAQERWCEIKPMAPDERESAVAQDLATASERPVAVLVGLPPLFWDEFFHAQRRELWPEPSPLSRGRLFYPASVDRQTQADKQATLFLCPACGTFRIASLSDSDWYCWGCGDHVTPFSDERLERAAHAARGARFEHGEHP